MKYICLVIFSLPIIGWMSGAEAAIRDEEIIERLVRLETAVEKLEIAVEKMGANLQRQIDEVKNFILWMGSIVFAGIFALIGFVIWDRRTVVAPVARELKEVVKREELILETLRRYGQEEPRMAEIMKRVGL